MPRSPRHSRDHFVQVQYETLVAPLVPEPGVISAQDIMAPCVAVDPNGDSSAIISPSKASRCHHHQPLHGTVVTPTDSTTTTTTTTTATATEQQQLTRDILPNLRCMKDDNTVSTANVSSYAEPNTNNIISQECARILCLLVELLCCADDNFGSSFKENVPGVIIVREKKEPGHHGHGDVDHHTANDDDDERVPQSTRRASAMRTPVRSRNNDITDKSGRMIHHGSSSRHLTRAERNVSLLLSSGKMKEINNNKNNSSNINNPSTAEIVDRNDKGRSKKRPSGSGSGSGSGGGSPNSRGNDSTRAVLTPISINTSDLEPTRSARNRLSRAQRNISKLARLAKGPAAAVTITPGTTLNDDLDQFLRSMEQTEHSSKEKSSLPRPRSNASSMAPVVSGRQFTRMPSNVQYCKDMAIDIDISDHTQSS